MSPDAIPLPTEFRPHSVWRAAHPAPGPCPGSAPRAYPCLSLAQAPPSRVSARAKIGPPSPGPAQAPPPHSGPRPLRELKFGRKKAPQRLCGRFSRISMKLPRIPLRRQKLPKVVGKDASTGSLVEHLSTQEAAGKWVGRGSV